MASESGNEVGALLNALQGIPFGGDFAERGCRLCRATRRRKGKVHNEQPILARPILLDGLLQGGPLIDDQGRVRAVEWRTRCRGWRAEAEFGVFVLELLCIAEGEFSLARRDALSAAANEQRVGPAPTACRPGSVLVG